MKSHNATVSSYFLPVQMDDPISRRASEPFGMAFEIAFKTAGRVSVPSETALEPYGRALKPRGGVLGASWEAGEERGETMKERKYWSISPLVVVP